jgi:hypothetical protein
VGLGAIDVHAAGWRLARDGVAAVLAGAGRGGAETVLRWLASFVISLAAAGRARADERAGVPVWERMASRGVDMTKPRQADLNTGPVEGGAGAASREQGSRRTREPRGAVVWIPLHRGRAGLHSGRVLALRELDDGGVAALIVVYLLGFAALGAGLDAVTNRVIADGNGITYGSWLRTRTFMWDEVIDLSVERLGRWDGRMVVRLRTRSRAKPIRLLCVGSYSSERKHAYIDAINAARPTPDP